MKCPKCGGALKSVQVEKVAIDQCPACTGLWVDGREMMGLLQLSGKTLAKLYGATKKVSGGAGSCPRCEDGTPLMKLPNPALSDQMSDTCPNCTGLWLEGSDLAKMKAKYGEGEDLSV